MAIPIAILDCDLLLHGRGHKTLDRFDLESVSDNFLHSQFGFPREFILYLIELLQEALCRRTQRSRAISPEVQVLAALGFYTSGSFQTSMGTTIGISQASMSRCVSDVTRALVEKAPQFITFNLDPLRRDQSFQEFQRVAGFPGVLGVLDCVQVSIKAPTIEDFSYVNKKGFHSVGCQLVCNAQGLLLSAETNWPGGLKATDILERSSLHKQMQRAEEGWLLGDRRYPLRKWMMTPVDSPETPAEHQYNVAHAATREVVDRTFRAIQSRFKCLDATKGYLQGWESRTGSCREPVPSVSVPRESFDNDSLIDSGGKSDSSAATVDNKHGAQAYSPERSSAILLACCVLHNAFLQSGFDAWTVEGAAPVEQPDSAEERTEENDSQAEETRGNLVLRQFS